MRADHWWNESLYAVGINFLRKGMYEHAEKHFRIAVSKVISNHTKPKFAEPLYYLGVTLMKQEKNDEAREWLHQAAWSYEWTSPSYTLLTQLECLRHDWKRAIENAKKACLANPSNIEALNLAAMILRHTGLFKEGFETASNALAIDPLNFNTLNELYLLSSKVNTGKTSNEWLNVLKEKLRNEPDSYLETATRYGAAGFFKEAIDFLGIAAASTNKVVNSNPMIYYYTGYYAALKGDKASAVKYFQKASQQHIDYIFPYGETSIKALNAAVALNPDDANAHYFLGNVYADNQPDKSIVEWQKAISLNSKTAIYYRNLAFVQANYTDNISGAVENIMKAISLDAKEARYFSEADNYMSYAKTLPEKIASFLEQHAASDNNDVKTIDIRLKNFMGDYDRSVSILEKLNFRTEEGAAFNVHVYWFDAHLLRGIKKMNAGAFNEAEKDFLRAMEFPANLESERDAKTGVALYFLGVNNKLNRNAGKAKEYFTRMVEYTYEQGWGAGSFPEINFYKRTCLQATRSGCRSREVFCVAHQEW